MAEPFVIGKGSEGQEVEFRPALANRHGLVTGATGTGKTVTLQMLSDHFSKMGVPVFLADVKGDLSGVAAAGTMTPKMAERLAHTGLPEPEWRPNPTVFWDVFGKRGFPVRATVSDIGPLLLGRLLNLNPTQEGVLAIVFRMADDNGWPLLDLKDLRAMLNHVAQQGKQLTTTYGNVSAASVGAIQRALLQVEEQGGDRFFGEPMLDIQDLLQTDGKGEGIVNVLAAEELIQAPKVYSTFLLWMLSELFEQLPEVGDPDKPTLVFFFDEAHLLFADAPNALVEKIQQVVRLIRSKGVGVYFVTQSPSDIPDIVLGQLGNRVQHALRAFTPRDQKAVKVAAETLRPNPAIDTRSAITELAVGEALVSVLDDKGSPTVVERVWVLPPGSQIGPISEEDRTIIREHNAQIYGHYEQTVDRESAYEKLTNRTAAKTAAADAPVVTTTAAGGAAAEAGTASIGGTLSSILFGTTGPRGGKHDGLVQSAARSAARSVGSGVGRAILRGALGSILGGTRRR